MNIFVYMQVFGCLSNDLFLGQIPVNKELNL